MQTPRLKMPISDEGTDGGRHFAATENQWQWLAGKIKSWGHELGFNAVGFAGVDLAEDEARLLEWLAQGMHGDMEYMRAHGVKRTRPSELIEGTVSVVSVRMNYLSSAARDAKEVLNAPDKAYIARYALGRDYHRLIRKRLQKLADRIGDVTEGAECRAFCDSAPVLEKPLSHKAGVAWMGKHTVMIDCNAGSWFFLGELYTNLPLPVSATDTGNYCGSCKRCLDVCPTRAIVSPWRLDAKRCIAYLTIEFKGSIPLELRPLIGNRIYGCDDCQIFCPWNRRVQHSYEPDFNPRRGVDNIDLLELFSWSRWQFEYRFEGSPIRRLGYECWLRNISVAIGNAPYSERNVEALMARRCDPSQLVAEHVRWALREQLGKCRQSRQIVDSYERSHL